MSDELRRRNARLASLGRLRELETRTAQEAHARSERRLARDAVALQVEERELSRASEMQREQQGGGSPLAVERLRQTGLYLDQQRRRRAQAQSRVTQAERLADESRERLAGSRAEERVAEKAQARVGQELRRALDRAEADRLDERASELEASRRPRGEGPAR